MELTQMAIYCLDGLMASLMASQCWTWCTPFWNLERSFLILEASNFIIIIYLVTIPSSV